MSGIAGGGGEGGNGGGGGGNVWRDATSQGGEE